ncbi:alpha/beta hydrolase fold protein [Pirellulimonas nuda]|uniref:Alpha/beta hydrolase fold protein n=1 Tax=Pirellulimonas nuda TaxID=2528009 RepID=A0A518DE10_9BACT|nr:alpha/beta hydrolase [Pirellulimonas nuda]QDU89707.1 alpha/beta hydrolase fold protein [Pirellulimonas nuda]
MCNRTCIWAAGVWVAASATSAFGQEASPAPAQRQQLEELSYDASVPPPTLTGVRYGPHRRNTLDFWKASSDGPTPLVMVIHGGGWNGGSSKQTIHKLVDTQALLDAGVSVASIHYRLIKHAGDLQPPVRAPLEDAARALQFIRSQAEPWNVDKSRIAAAGGSAGGCSSLWLACHDDLAQPQSPDPVARESTRLACVALNRPQTTLDPQQMKAWIPNSSYGAHAFAKESFQQFLAERESLSEWIEEYSPYGLLDARDPPAYLWFSNPPSGGKPEKDPTHSAAFGVKFKQRCDQLGVACEVQYPGAPDVQHKTPTDYLIAFFGEGAAGRQ